MARRIYQFNFVITRDAAPASARTFYAPPHQSHRITRHGATASGYRMAGADQPVR
jgi:hypothetical protein